MSAIRKRVNKKGVTWQIDYSAHLRELVNLLNTLPNGKESVNILPFTSRKAGGGLNPRPADYESRSLGFTTPSNIDNLLSSHDGNDFDYFLDLAIWAYNDIISKLPWLIGPPL